MSLARVSFLSAVGLILAAAVLPLGGRAEAAIYWGDGAPIGRANLDGSYVQSEFVPQQPFTGEDESAIACGGVAVDASHLYWAEPARGTIARANLDGSGANHSFITGADNPCGLAIDGSHLYWANFGEESPPAFGSGPIGRARLDGSEVDQDFISGIGRACGVAVSATHLYWTTGQGWVGRALRSGAAVEEELIEDDEAGCGVAVDGQHLYWSRWIGAIGRAELDGADPELEFIGGVERPCGLAIYGGRIFWGVNHPIVGTVGSANLDGSGVNGNLVGRQRLPCGVAVDGTSYAPPPPAPPASEFGFGRVKHKKPAWSVFVAIELPEAGTLAVTPSPGTRVVLRPAPAGGRVAAGRVWVKVSPLARGWAASKLRDRIERHGKAKVSIRVAYTADGRAPTAKRRPLWLLAKQR